jgi:hypothetical protein
LCEVFALLFESEPFCHLVQRINTIQGLTGVESMAGGLERRRINGDMQAKAPRSQGWAGAPGDDGDPGTVRIQDAAGAVLAYVTLEPCPAGKHLRVERVVAGKGRLLSHYFVRGCRDVFLCPEPFRIPARLSTRWLGHMREWTLELRHIEWNGAEPWGT